MADSILERKLWRKVRRYVRFLRLIPFLRMVAVCNNLAFGKVDEKSDIDLFIVAKSGRLFTVRILVTLILHILGVRRHGKKIAGRFCLSFFVDDSALDLSRIALQNDIYLAFWVRSMIPVIDDGVCGEFLAANTWVKDYFGGVGVGVDTGYASRGGFLQSLFAWLLDGRLGDWFEKKMRDWQLKRASEKVKMAEDDASLIVDEHVLKFHNIDRRREYRSAWVKQYGSGVKLSDERFLKL